ncbi:MAG: rhomboid family intramembrane serine protease [Saprospiraceae bacterium]
MNFNLLPVTKNLIIINVLIFFGTMAWQPIPGILEVDIYKITSVFDLGNRSLSAFYPTSPLFQPFQIVTNMFMHGDFWHLLFNMIMMFFFGSLVESSMGSKRFLMYYLIAGFGALATYYLMAYANGPSMGGSVLGASGAIYGVMLAYAYIAPNQEIRLLFPPIPVKVKYMVTALILYDMFSGIAGGSGTAHYSHIGGGLIGLALCYFWSQRGGLHE